MSNDLQCELSDIMEMIHRFTAVNKNNTVFIGSFVVFDKEGDTIDEANAMVAYGDKEQLRVVLNELRDVVEDEANKDGFVNI